MASPERWVSTHRSTNKILEDEDDDEYEDD